MRPNLLFPRLALLALLVVGVLAAACPSDDDSVLPPAEPPVEEPPAFPLWSREIHRSVGHSRQQIPPQPLDGGDIIAILHTGDSISNALYHIEPMTGRVVDSFLIDDPVFDFGSVSVYSHASRIGDDLIAEIQGWPFRLSLRDGTLRWIRPQTYKRACFFEGQFYGEDFADWGELPAIHVVDLETGALVDSIGALPGLDYTNRKGGFGAIRAFRNAGGQRLLYSTYSSVEATSNGIESPTTIRVLFDLDTEEILWSHAEEISGFTAVKKSPIYHDGVLAVAMYDTLYGYDVADGSVLWRYDHMAVPFPAGVPTSATPEDRGSALAIASQPAYDAARGIGCYSSYHFQYCVNLTDGTEVWRGGTGRGSTGAGTGFIGSGFLGNAASGTLNLLDRHTGELLVQFDNEEHAEFGVGAPPGIFTSLPYYDPEREIVIAHDGYRAVAWSLNIDPPGE